MSGAGGQDADVIVLGGGASGLMAAGQSAALGARTLLIEKMERPGRKLRITGKGRCNLTNDREIAEFITHFGDAGPFLRSVFHRFFVGDLIAFLDELDLPTVIERGRRVFPASGRAQDVLDTLVRWAGQRGVRTLVGHAARDLVVEGGWVRGVKTETFAAKGSHFAGPLFKAPAVILATGGASYPATGSTGDGYRIARSCGHRIVPVRPALVPLETNPPPPALLQGLTLRNTRVRVLIGDDKGPEAFGEILFTPQGVSGPVALTLSRAVVDALRSGLQVRLSLDLKPALDAKTLDARLLRDLDGGGKKHLRNLLPALIPKALIPLCLDETGISGDTPACHIRSSDRARLRIWLKDVQLEIIGHRPFEEAIMTAGGVDRDEIDPRTMASRVVKGLYFAGEVMDVDADTGGYNLQAAFSTGWLAGRSAALAARPSLTPPAY